MRFTRRDGVVAEPLGDRIVVLDWSGETIHTLSRVGSIVWECLPADKQTILDLLYARFPNVPADVLSGDLDQFLEELGQRELIVLVDAAH